MTKYSSYLVNISNLSSLKCVKCSICWYNFYANRFSGLGGVWSHTYIHTYIHTESGQCGSQYTRNSQYQTKTNKKQTNKHKHTNKWNMLSSDDKILIKTCGNLKDFLPKDSSRNSLSKIEKTNIWRLSVNVSHKHFDRTHYRKRPATVITLSQLKTQLRWSCKIS